MTYKSSHHALSYAFVDHSRPAHSGWQDLYRSGFDQERGPVSLLSGMEEVAGEAAIVLKHLGRMSDTPAAFLVLKTCPAMLRHPSIPNAMLQHPMYWSAAHWLAQESAQLVTGLSNYRARRDAVRRACGAKINVGVTADKCAVNRNTVKQLNAKVKRWIAPIEERAWREIEDRLQAAGLIDVELIYEG